MLALALPPTSCLPWASLTKQLVPFYFLGFLLCSYANVPVLGVALIAIIIGIDKFDLLGLGGAQPQLSAEGDEDDDF